MVPNQKKEHGMRLLGESLKSVHTFQAHMVKLATEEGTWTARCRQVHLDGTVGLPSRTRVPNEYVTELARTGRKLLPIARRAYIGLPPVDKEAHARTMGDSIPCYDDRANG